MWFAPSTSNLQRFTPCLLLLCRFPLSPPPPLLPSPQRHNGYIYATAHARDVDGRDRVKDGCMPVDIDAGFEVAPGDAGDIEVAIAPFFLSVKT